MIRDQTRGCHSWSLNGGAYRVAQTLVLNRGGSISITNNDAMPHQLIKTSGLAVTYTRLATVLRKGHPVFVPAGANHQFIGYEQLACS